MKTSVLKMSFYQRRVVVVKGAEEATRKNALLDSDDIRPLALRDRTRTSYTYILSCFGLPATGTSDKSVRKDRDLRVVQSATGMAQVLLRHLA